MDLMDLSSTAAPCKHSQVSVAEVDNTPSTLAGDTPQNNLHESPEGFPMPTEGLGCNEVGVQHSAPPNTDQKCPSKETTVIIFDWDDTILPTTTLRSCSRPTSYPNISSNNALSLGVIMDAPELDDESL
eukprot:Blabericola_migrator_1__3511@NODE_2040_length_3379_cov_208_454710_g1295_i0_p3_GENE_NODE_2040_length_3379_cov_208_454710_g1295_i0NODE_2040_length_3379_cov_208_454710_g1295_i0_p3_ORF_typecomplete_len129_score16_79_NODE_2040_length_3379_cov_208_454710_g1295_i0185571